MPPIGSRTRAERERALREGRVQLVRRGGKPSHFRIKPRKYYRKRARKGNRSGQDVLMLKTLLPNEQKLSVTYRDSINFTDMGSTAQLGNGYTPTILRFNMNNPNFNASADSRIGNVITQSNVNTATFVHENPNKNLESNLQPYYDEYYNAVVTSSVLTCNLRFKPNQIGVSEHLENVGDGTEADPYRLHVADPDKVGDGFFWAVSQRNQGDISSENPTLWQLKREIPGVSMKRMTLARNGIPSKGIVFKATYTPHKSAGIKDWKDNLSDFNFDASSSPGQTRYTYVGCTSQQQPLMADLNLADVYVDYQVTYNITFLNRKNVVGANNPIGHAPDEL